MTGLFSGLLIGSVIGLTGAGGSLVAIPIFMRFFLLPLKEATVVSLFAVAIAAVSNLIAQRASINFKTALIIAGGSLFGSAVSTPIKDLLSPVSLSVLLSVVSLFALFSVWYPPKRQPDGGKIKRGIFFSLSVGFSLGTLTTVTGLGGGVVMLPVFLRLYHFDQPQAVATSLFVIGASSVISLLVQVQLGAKIPPLSNFFLLVPGLLIASFFLRKITELLSPKHLLILRQLTFTVVVVFSLHVIFIQN
jgi:uncharacterized membrane protein YfcA